MNCQQTRINSYLLHKFRVDSQQQLFQLFWARGSELVGESVIFHMHTHIYACAHSSFMT